MDTKALQEQINKDPNLKSIFDNAIQLYKDFQQKVEEKYGEGVCGINVAHLQNDPEIKAVFVYPIGCHTTDECIIRTRFLECVDPRGQLQDELKDLENMSKGYMNLLPPEAK